MLRITAVSAGAVDYLIKGSGCEREPQTVAPEKQQDAPGYYLSATEHGEAPGVWHGKGVEMLGIQRGSTATEDDVRAVFGELKHPETGDALGRAPRKFKDYEARLQAALAKEPEATPERREEIEIDVKNAGRKAVAYYDLTFSPAKSVSVYYAALLAAGATEDAEKVLAAHREAIDVAMDYAEQHAAYTRTGYHGRTASGRSVGRYEEATGLVQTRWDHSTNRENEPQIHTHVAVLNRVQTRSDGEIRSLDGKGFRPIKEGIDALYTGALEQKMRDSLGVSFGWRPDGKAREILGVDPELCAAASTRRADVERRTEELVADYIERHGHEPTPAARKAIAQNATFQTRKAKDTSAGPQALIGQWSADKRDQVLRTVDAVREASAGVDLDGHPDVERLPDQRDRRAIIQAAVEYTQNQYSTWTIGNLMSAIERHLTTDSAHRNDVEALANEAICAGNEYGVLMLTVPDSVEAPAALRRADGRSVYRAHINEHYATSDHLTIEERIVVGARQNTAPKLAESDLEMLRVELAANGLGEDQINAVTGVVSSGRAGDALIGPAGAGKSFTVATLSQVWQQHFGGRVLGLATSQRATDVLAEDGVEALNTTRFLNRFDGPDARDQVQPGDLFVVDESGMSSTNELARISRIVEAGGGKLLYTGDHQQLDAVGAGGILEMLTTDNGAYELEEIHRFSNDWEKDASARLRVGDVDVLREYEHRGRLRGGAAEEMQDAAVRGYLADTLSGRESLLVVPSNEQATDLSARIHAELVRLGKVSEEVLGTLRDGNLIGAGDVIQARHNDPNQAIDGPGMVTNRQTYTVLGTDEQGRVAAQREDGAVAHLTEQYVREHVTLAYASTVHAAQGRTVDTAHGLIEETTGRDAAYVALTRGRDSNIAYTITTREPDEHEPERLDATPHGVMATVLDNDDRQRAAVATLAENVAESRQLSVIGTQWDLVSKEYARDRYTDTLAAMLPPERMDALVDEYGYDRLMRSVREAEMAGHHPEAVLREAVEARELDTADSVSDVLRYRVRHFTAGREPEQHVDPTNWATLGAPVDGTIGQYAQELAVAASDRQAELGRQAAEQQPEWAVAHLGALPQEPTHRAEWERRAGIAAAYRELRNIAPEATSIGAAPSREQEFHRALWQQAHAALGRPADALDFHTASDTELREMRARWQREQTWAPHYVATELQQAYTVAEGYRQDATLYRAELDTLAEDSPTRAEAIEQVERAERLAAEYTERAQQLEEIHAARAGWREATDDTRLRAELATDELRSRNAPLQVERPQPEQLAMFRIADEYAVGPDQGHPAARQAEREHSQDADVEVDHERRHEPELEPAEPVGWWQRWAAKFGLGRDDQREPQIDGAESAPNERQRDDDVLVPDAEAEHRGPEQRQAAEDVEPTVDPDQLALFDVEPDVADVVRAQPVREQEPEQDEDLRATLAEARQRARAAEQLRLQRDATERQRAEKQAQINAAEMAADADRKRRDVAELAAEKQTSRQAEQVPQQERAQDDPGIELVQTPVEPPPGPDLEPGQ